MPLTFIGSRGQYATSPYHFPPKGWRQVLVRVKNEVAADNLSIVAAGVAFYSFLALFPAIGVFTTIYGLASDPVSIQPQLSSWRALIPADVFEMIIERLEAVAAAEEATLTVGLMFSLALALWSATKGTKAMMTALNIAYEETERRGFFALNLMAITFTVGGMILVAASLGFVAAIPVLIDAVGLGDLLAPMLLWFGIAILAVFIMCALALLYRFGPSRRHARIQWITPGASLAAALWLLASAGFSFYIANFGNYDEVFGSLGAVAVLLLWLYISAYVTCLGAELNAELERQTYRDSTVGPTLPVGMRGAFVADNPADPHVQN